MRIQVQDVREGPHPSESIVTVNTVTGPEELIVDARSGRSGSIEVGNPVAQSGDYYLVELPCETSSGAWRVWIDKNAIVELEAAE